MNAEKIIDGLRYCDESAGLCIGCPLDMDFKDDKYCNIRLEAADLIESLLAQLAESRRRERAAVEDLELVCAGGESCFVCKNLENRGDDFPCIYGEGCMGEKWQWRGPQDGE